MKNYKAGQKLMWLINEPACHHKISCTVTEVHEDYALAMTERRRVRRGEVLNMMYNEFINLSGKQENYITYSEYTEMIEPIYMNCELQSKQDFIRFFNEVFEEIVYPIINNTISKLPIEEKLSYLYYQNTDIEKHIKEIDAEARLLAYKYMRLYLKA